MFKTQCQPTHLFLEEHFSEHNEWADLEMPAENCQSLPIKLLDLKNSNSIKANTIKQKLHDKQVPSYFHFSSLLQLTKI